MRVIIRFPELLLREIVQDLVRPHEIAAERIGFVGCRESKTPAGVLLLPYRYLAVDDDQYLPDDRVGARFGSGAIRSGMQLALSEHAAVLHVHMHDHSGPPSMSRTDTIEMQKLMPCFVNVQPHRAHGALILSRDSAFAKVWGVNLPKHGTEVSKITSVSQSMIRFL